MLDIADALGDTEAYLAEYRDHNPEALTVPAIAAMVATRLTKAGRAEEALTLLQAADPRLGQRRTGAEEWCDARLDALEALGSSDDAQAQRWEFALMELSARHLRYYPKRLPAFEEMPAEEKALDLVADHDDLEEALWFLLHWPEPHRAARLVLAAPKPLNGDRYFLLAPLAELLEQRHPLAATVCLRCCSSMAATTGSHGGRGSGLAEGSRRAGLGNLLRVAWAAKLILLFNLPGHDHTKARQVSRTGMCQPTTNAAPSP